jgi:hypothetical protein
MPKATVWRQQLESEMKGLREFARSFAEKGESALVVYRDDRKPAWTATVERLAEAAWLVHKEAGRIQRLIKRYKKMLGRAKDGRVGWALIHLTVEQRLKRTIRRISRLHQGYEFQVHRYGFVPASPDGSPLDKLDQGYEALVGRLNEALACFR